MPSLMRDVNIIARCSGLFRNDKLEKYGICGSMYTIIINICRNPGLSQEKLAKLICINKSNVARKLAALEKNGFVTRKPGTADKRVLEVYPTKKAEKVLPEILSVLREWNEYVTSDLTSSQSELLWEALEKMREKAQSYARGREEEEL